MAKSTELVDQYARGLLAMAEAEGETERLTDELMRFGQALEQHNELR